MPVVLPPRPSLEWLRKTAKDRLADLRAGNSRARLSDAHLAVARQYGFPSWRQLKAHVDQISNGVEQRHRLVSLFFRLVATGDLARVRALLSAAPALVNVVGPHPFWSGRPQPLHLAIEGTRREMFDLLLASGADINGTNDQYDHWSPLMLAIDRDQPDMQQELFRRGATIGLPEALMLGDDARVESLLAGGLPPIAPNGGSFLALARTPYAVDRLLALGASTDAKDRWGSTPIDALSRRGPKGAALIKHLVTRGIAAAPTEYARIGDRETLERLVNNDPSIARRDDVVMAAVDFGHCALVRWLLERGGNVNARSMIGSGGTALHSAAWNGDLDMVRLLVEAGADLQARDREHDNTPLGWAETSLSVMNNQKCRDVADYLRAMTTT